MPFDAFNDKIKIVVPEGRGPDLFIFTHDLVGAWSEMGIIEPLSNWTTAECRTLPAFDRSSAGLSECTLWFAISIQMRCAVLQQSAHISRAAHVRRDGGYRSH